MSGWLPIASAPKDGTRILVFDPEGDGDSANIVLVAWLNDAERHRKARFMWCVPDSWQDEQGGYYVVGRPTHWQPLPPSPDHTPSVEEGLREKVVQTISDCARRVLRQTDLHNETRQACAEAIGYAAMGSVFALLPIPTPPDDARLPGADQGSEAATLDRFASCGEYSASEEAIFRSAANEIHALRKRLNPDDARLEKMARALERPLAFFDQQARDAKMPDSYREWCAEMARDLRSALSASLREGG